MKIYTVAEKKEICYGMGGYYEERKICPMGSYGEGPFPKFFKTQKEADELLKSLDWKHDRFVVELELVENTP
jgi:hypothetical protein